MNGKRTAPRESGRNPSSEFLEREDFYNARGSLVKEKKARLPERKRKRRRILIVLVVMLAVILGLTIAWKSVVHQPLVPSTKNQTENLGSQPITGGERKKDFYTFLVVGRDDGGGGNTDTLMLVAYDAANQNVNVMSIYRDTLVNVPWEIKKINSVYNVKGIDGLLQQVGKLTGFLPDYYFVMELDAVSELVNSIGGVDFDVPQNMSYDDPAQDLHIHFSKGMQHLNGDDAVKILRWRKNNSGSTHASVGDIGRVEVQHKFLSALAQQTLKVGNVTKVKEITKIINKNLDSNLSYGEMLWFGQKLMGIDANHIQFFNMPCNTGVSVYSKTYHNYQSYVAVNAEEMLDMVNQHFNPYLEEVTVRSQDIMTGAKSSKESSVSETKQDSEKKTDRAGKKAASGTKSRTDTDKKGNGEAPSETNGKPVGGTDIGAGAVTGETTGEATSGTSADPTGGISENPKGDDLTEEDIIGSGGGQPPVESAPKPSESQSSQQTSDSQTE